MSHRSPKLPALQFYPGDWHKDPGVKTLNLEERGAWFEILLLMHESEQRGRLTLKGKPYPVEFLAVALGTNLERTKQIISKLLATEVASIEESTGVIYSRRMLRDEELRHSRALAGREGGKQKAANRVAKATPSSSSSSSTSSGRLPSIPDPKMEEAASIPAELRGLKLYEADRKLCARWPTLYPELKSTYPQLDVLSEIRRAHAWELTHYRKVNRPAYFVKWLNRAQDSLGSRGVPQRSAPAVRVNAPGSLGCSKCDKGFIRVKSLRDRGPNWSPEEVEGVAPCPYCNSKGASA